MPESTDLLARPRGSEMPNGICDPNSPVTISPKRGGREAGVALIPAIFPAHVGSADALLLLRGFDGLTADANVLFECWSSTVNLGRCVRGNIGDVTRLEIGSLVACPGLILLLLPVDDGELRSGIRREPLLDVPRGIELACPLFWSNILILS